MVIKNGLLDVSNNMAERTMRGHAMGRSNYLFCQTYSFRHNYAVQNIISWKHDGFDFDMKLLALSKSMGHGSPDATLYYFHLVPQFTDLLEEAEGDFISELLPGIR